MALYGYEMQNNLYAEYVYSDPSIQNYATNISPGPNAIQCFSMGSSSHYQHFVDEGPSTSYSSSYPLPPLPHATGLAIPGNPTSLTSEYCPEDIWSSNLVHGIPPLDNNFQAAKSYSGPAGGQPQGPASQSLPTLADMAILYSAGSSPSSGQSQSTNRDSEEHRVPSSTQDEEAQSERRHPCPMCYKRFDRPSTLKKHMLVHTGEKAFQCETCGRRFGVHSNLNRHRARCILKPVHAIRSSSQPSEEQSNNAGQPAARGCEPELAKKQAAQKRRRRAPSQFVWIPDSLKSFNLKSEDSHKATPVPLPPISPSQFEERDSWDENVGLTPYHPQDWEKKPRLPGPARPMLGLGGKNMKNFDFAGQGAFMITAY